jgi:lipopolysaccharide/colanic/teichoic acid biosynthesis glycosyltransferase
MVRSWNPGVLGKVEAAAHHAESSLVAMAPALDRVACRALDIVFALAVLVLASPVLALVALVIVMESPGPIFYRARRVGRDGRNLRMLKFRKMRRDACGPPLTTCQDRRLTRVGRVLVSLRIDELPQLWHVLRGEMSLVGPRPEDPLFVAQRPDDYRTILTVRPGLSGLSQLAYADERRILCRPDPMTDYLEHVLPQKCTLDRLYVERRSLATNLRVIAWTLVETVLRRPVAVDRSTGAMRLRRRPADLRLPEGVTNGVAWYRAPLSPSPPRAAAELPSCERTAEATPPPGRTAPSQAAAASPPGKD